MKYYCMDDTEISIRTKIKNLYSISAAFSKNSGVIALTVSTIDGFVYTMDSKNKHFDLYFKYVKDAYQKEKDVRDIIILDERLKNLLDSSYEYPYPKNFQNRSLFSDKKINHQKYDLNSISPIIYELIAVVFGVQGIRIDNLSQIRGMRDFFSIVVDTPELERVIPIKFKKNNDFDYSLVLGNMYGFKSIEADITYTPTYIWVTWRVAGINISGSMRYNISKDNINLENQVFYNDVLKYTKEENIESSSILPEEIKNLEDFSNYKIYTLPNGLIIATHIKDDEIDVSYISNNSLICKIRNLYERTCVIEGITCPVTSIKRVNEVYKIDDTLSLSQQYFDDIPYESDLYRNGLVNKVAYEVILDGIHYPIQNDVNIDYFGSLDRDIILKTLERKDK